MAYLSNSAGKIYMHTMVRVFTIIKFMFLHIQNEMVSSYCFLSSLTLVTLIIQYLCCLIVRFKYCGKSIEFLCPFNNSSFGTF